MNRANTREFESFPTNILIHSLKLDPFFQKITDKVWKKWKFMKIFHYFILSMIEMMKSENFFMKVFLCFNTCMIEIIMSENFLS